jgi:hypothetical protein
VDSHHIDRGPALDCIFGPPHAFAMTRACCFVALSFMLAACNPCNRIGCDAIGTPAADNGKSEMAGFISSESDVVANGCQECPFASATLAIWAAPGPVTDVLAARAIVQAAPATVTLQADGHYRQALDPGSYLLCTYPSSLDTACVGVAVIAGHVAPVNLKGPFQFIVFDPQTRAHVSAPVLFPGT